MNDTRLPAAGEISRLIDAAVDRLADELVRTRRHLHMHPEPSGEEFATTRFVADRLGAAGIPHRVLDTGRGVIADSPAPPRVPRVAIRGDMDALRIADEKTAPYRSKVDGVMHACGHDAHTAMALAATLALWEAREAIGSCSAFRTVFQPSEETGLGGPEMVAAGATEGISAIVALHVDPERGVGEIGTRIGPLTACCRELAVTVRGRSGHAARPHQTIDPIAAAVRFASEVYQEVRRGIDARDPVVVAFGSIHGGTSPNVIPETVTLRGTLRTLFPATAEQARVILERIAAGVSLLTGTQIELRVIHGPDAVMNDSLITRTVSEVCARLVGQEKVRPIELASMGGEDFSAYLADVPGCMFRLGVASEKIPREVLHSARFDIDERALVIGAKALAHTAAALGRLVNGDSPCEN